MKSIVVISCVLFVVGVRAEQKIVRGKITYIASGVVYTSLGREAGVQDSTLLFVASHTDTSATLKVFAVSSKSSACWIVKAHRPVIVGDDVSGKIEIVEMQTFSRDTSTVSEKNTAVALHPPTLRSPARQEALSLQGRVSAQYFTTLYNNTAYNISQPGMVLNVRGSLRDIPLKFDVYANLRTLSIGGQSPFSKSAINQSRIYGLAVSYDDGDNVLSFGRIIPVFSPSIGYIDGALVSRKFGNVVVGATLGYQPDFSLRGISTNYRKMALFTQYAAPDRWSLSISTAYARTYFHSALDREAASVLINASLATNLFLYANTEVDLRKKSGTEFILAPSLTSAYANLNYRITQSFSVGIGADASRPYYSFESVRRVPDSLLSHTLRSGISINVNLLLPGGISLYNTYTPRNADNAAFGSEYSNYGSINITDILSSGVNLRTSMNLNANQYTNGTGYGVSLQKTFAQVVDVNLRYQRNGYTVKQTDQRSNSTSFGADVMIFLTKSLTFLTTYDRLDGYGTVSNSVFAEFGVRF